MTELTEKQTALCESSETDYSDLRAFFINCTLKRSPEVSNTQGLMLKDAGGIPAHGNQRTAWDAGCRFDFPNPDYR